MRSTLKHIVLFLLATFCSVSMLAQKNVHIYGYIYDQERKVAPFVTVQAIGTTIGTTSRNDGYYELNVPVKDTTTVRFFLLGCKEYRYKLTSKRSSIQKIVYLQENTIVLHDAEVREYRQQNSSIQQLDISQLKKMPNANGGIESMLSTYAGVSSTNEMSSQYSVRGGSYDENSVYVNNIEVYRPLLVRSGQQEGLSFINPDLVSSINFSAGGYSANYGDKMASVLDITYKKPTEFEGNISGSLLGGSAYIGHATKNGKFTQIHGLRYKSSDYLFNSLDTKGTYDQKFIDYQTYITYAFANQWEASVLGNFSQNKYTSIPESMTTTFGTISSPTTFHVYFDGQEKDIFQTVFSAATIKFTPVNNIQLSLTGSSFDTQENINYDIQGEYWLSEAAANESTDDSNTLGVGSYLDYARNSLETNVNSIAHKGDWFISKSNRVSWGVSFQQEYIDDKTVEFQTKDSAGYTLPYKAENLSVYYNLQSKNAITSYRTQFFLQNEFKIHATIGTFNFIGGLRGNYWTFNKEMLVSPRASVAFIPNKNRNWNFRFATGLYYQSPFYKELKDTVTDAQGNTTVQLNKNLKAQRSLHFVLGSDYLFKLNSRPFKFTTELYYKPADRIISYTVDNMKIVYSGQNDAKAYAAGIDFKLFGEFVPGTDSWINLSLMQSKEDIAGDNVGYVSRPNEQRYNFSMFFQDYFPGYPKYKVNLRFIWSDGLPFWAPNVTTHTNSNTNRSKSYRRVDIGLSRSITKGDFKLIDATQAFKVIKSINLALEVFNLLDISNVASYYWVSDVDNYQHAVPNNLTRRQLNARMSIDF